MQGKGEVLQTHRNTMSVEEIIRELKPQYDYLNKKLFLSKKEKKLKKFLGKKLYFLNIQRIGELLELERRK
jgi:uncharacterized protein YqiB (DUF1249 family)